MLNYVEILLRPLLYTEDIMKEERTMAYDYLFTPFKIGTCEIRNRVIIPAMEGTNIIENMFGTRFNKNCYEYYMERSKNGVGLFIPGMIPVYSMFFGKWLHKNPKPFQEAKPLIDEIHKNGSKIFFQLGAGFAGRNFTIPQQLISVAEKPFLKTLTNPFLHLKESMAAPDAGLPLVWAPQLQTRALTRKEIQNYIEAYAKGAKLCKDIGVDGVEVHAVHEGYLMDQFTTKYTNHRTDEYGGSFENRYRFAVEVVKAIKKECGEDYPVMLRYSITSKTIDYKVGAVPGETFTEIGRDMKESEKAAKYLQDAGYDALNCDNGTYDSWYWAHLPVYMPLNCNLKDAEHISKFVDIPVIVAGRMQPEDAEKSIKDGKIDAVAIGRQFICDGEYLTKLKSGREEDIRPCISCHNACLPVAYYKNSGAVMDMEAAQTQGHCALNPVSFAEKKYVYKKTQTPKRISIIGGGVAGMQAALLLDKKGHHVDLYEKTDRLGGVFIAAAAPSFKEKDKDLLKWYENQLEKSNVSIHMNTEITDLKSLYSEEYIIATGSTPRKIPVKGFEKGIGAIEYLNKEKEVGDTVVVIGGGLTGCEIAYNLVLEGKTPVIVEMTDELVKAKGICAANSECLRDLIRYYKVKTYLESSLKEIKENSVIISKDGKDIEISCDSVILSVGYVSNKKLVTEEKNVHVLGDADRVANLKKAIWDAYDLALEI